MNETDEKVLLKWAELFEEYCKKEYGQIEEI